MKYMGSKSKIAKEIVPIIQKYIDDYSIDSYYELFCGGCNIIDKISCKNKYAFDKNKYLIALFKHIQGDNPLYECVSKETYCKARECYYKQNDDFQNWELGNIGFLASYNGRFFDGGYAIPRIEKTKNGERYRDYYNEAKQNILKQSLNLKNVVFKEMDYFSLQGQIHNAVIYLDPPYQNTKQYNVSINFDYDKFWQFCRELSKDNIVLISEEHAPDDFKCIWSQEVCRSIKAKNKHKSIEKLFIY